MQTARAAAISRRVGRSRADLSHADFTERPCGLPVARGWSNPIAGDPWAALDQAAAELGHALGPVRLAFGEALNALEHQRGHHELGFASLTTYATERAGKSRRWVAESRALATSLEHLTTLRRQLLSGRLSWTRAELLAKLVERTLAFHRVTNPDAARALRPALELSWFFRSSGLTCRELNEHLRSIVVDSDPGSTAESLRSLTLTVPTEDTWWFRAAERTFRRVAERSDLDAFLEALLAETQNTLGSDGLVSGQPLTREREGFEARDRWLAQLDQWRTRAEHLCEHARRALPRPRLVRREARPWPTPDDLRGWSPLDLNRHVIALAKKLHINAAALGRSAEALHNVEAWRHLGFASPGHYARDRLGVSLSSLKQKRALARRLAALPLLAHALETGKLGFVAASLVARVATSTTERRWVERARQRTVRHLREEVTFVERIQRSRPGHRGWPPSPEVMRADLALRGTVVADEPWLRRTAPPKRDPSLGPCSAPSSSSPAATHAKAEQLRHLERVIRDYGTGVDAICSPAPSLHAVRLLPSASSRHLPCTAASYERTLSTLSDPCPQNRCSAGDSARPPPDVVATPGQTSVHEKPVDSAWVPCLHEPRQCTTDPPCQGRSRRPHLTGDGLALGTTRLRLRVYESTLLLYREVARAFARQHPTRRLLRSLCEHFLEVWGPVVARKGPLKYQHIYERDAYTCTNPVCDRHDVTPHHLKFRSRGGGDEPENLTSLCVWCHLEGVHGGRIRAEPQADGIRWTIGRIAPVVVVDRDKIELS